MPSAVKPGSANDKAKDSRKMMAGPQLHANWLMPMFAARLVEVDVSEM